MDRNHSNFLVSRAVAKYLDRNSVIGRQGVNLVEKLVLSMGYAWNETRMDAGIDGTSMLLSNSVRNLFL